jgi:hypothetical protein
LFGFKVPLLLLLLLLLLAAADSCCCLGWRFTSDPRVLQGADCAQQCLMVESNDVCSEIPPLRSSECSKTAKVREWRVANKASQPVLASLTALFAGALCCSRHVRLAGTQVKK